MTVTVLPGLTRGSGGESDAGRLGLTAANLVARARAIVQQYGHARDDGFGSPALGFTLVGAVYRAAGFYEDRFSLRDPWICPAHRAKVGVRPACEPGCEDGLWRQCNLAFSYLAAAAQTGVDELPDLESLTPAPRDYRIVVEVSDVLDNASARQLLMRVLRALHPDLARLRRPVQAVRDRLPRPNAKLTPESAAAIRREYAAGTRTRELAQRYGVSQPLVISVVAGSAWRSAPGPTGRRPALRIVGDPPLAAS